MKRVLVISFLGICLLLSGNPTQAEASASKVFVNGVELQKDTIEIVYIPSKKRMVDGLFVITTIKQKTPTTQNSIKFEDIINGKKVKGTLYWRSSVKKNGWYYCEYGGFVK